MKSARRKKTNSLIAAEIRAMRRELKAGQLAQARYAAEAAALIRRWQGDGLPEPRT